MFLNRYDNKKAYFLVLLHIFEVKVLLGKVSKQRSIKSVPTCKLFTVIDILNILAIWILNL